METMNADDFFVDDEPLDAVEAAFAAGSPVVTGRPTVSGRSRGKRSTKFVIRRTSGGGYEFSLVAANGDVIATSETYTTKAAALRSIAAVKATAAAAEVESSTA